MTGKGIRSGQQESGAVLPALILSVFILDSHNETPSEKMVHCMVCNSLKVTDTQHFETCQGLCALVKLYKDKNTLSNSYRS